MHIILLTHQKERFKKTNTGLLVLLQPGLNVTRIIWDRVNPDAALLKRIAKGGVFLLYPEQNSSGQESARQSFSDPVSSERLAESAVSLELGWQDSADEASFIIIDSTWQEARKIFNRSPYLTDLPRITLAPSEGSLFKLRRNQIARGLCTAESVIALLKMNHQNHLANKLETDFYTFVGHVPEKGKND
ncbi:tRNA-uridine aminocarboxypropyltransferase [Neptunomonas qingdaonensis]|uniref:tRNA-uridine aminocarboxypropyltransferase n=1 Tax=Neptunomonas qingdaonensis TaxID=1045558 RepID=A0A1I2RHM9_9GAMM|nr:tRNA-uridine aminocarboxypropyltransferase [Neptunomonas qingdaonensis]SFG40165.1 DTW domain-containing protein [Neptunomonas qingdaonensis]